MNLAGVISLVPAHDRVPRVIVGSAEVVEAAGIRLDLLARPAEKLVHWKAGDATGEVPQRQIEDAAHILRKLHRPQLLPDEFPVEWIVAGQDRAQELRDDAVARNESVLVAMEMAAEVVALGALVG